MRRRVLVLLIFIIPILLYVLIALENEAKYESIPKPLAVSLVSGKYDGPSMNKIHQQWLKTLLRKRSIQNTVVISLVDLAYVEIALNLWESSLNKFNISNCIFVCTDEESHKILTENGIESFVFEQQNIQASKSSHMHDLTETYTRKRLLQVELSYFITTIGYNVLILDLDIVFLQNPLLYLVCDDCDVILLTDNSGEVSTGLYLIKATSPGVEMLRRTMDLSLQHNLGGQILINGAIKQMKDIKVKQLPPDTFCSGCNFPQKHAGDIPLKNCVIFHNNCQNGHSNKTYTLKEMNLWVRDTDQYYSSQTNKYLTYESKNCQFRTCDELEMLRLALAVGKKLRRILILPKFYCGRQQCDFVNKFAHSGNLNILKPTYEGLYREYSFLSHPKVPNIIKQSIAEIKITFSSEVRADTSVNEILVDTSYKSKEVPMAIAKNIIRLNLDKYNILILNSMAGHSDVFHWYIVLAIIVICFLSTIFCICVLMCLCTTQPDDTTLLTWKL